MGKANKVTEEELQIMIQDYKSGMSCREIGLKLNRHRTVVMEQLKKCGEFISTANLISNEELNGIINDYTSGMSCNDIGEKYNRLGSTIIWKLQSIGAYEKVTCPWTDDEIQILNNVYPKECWKDILRQLPNHSKQSIIQKAFKLNISRDFYFWSEKDVDILRDNYCTVDNISELIDMFEDSHTYAALRAKAEKLGWHYKTDLDTGIALTYKDFLTNPMRAER